MMARGNSTRDALAESLNLAGIEACDRLDRAAARERVTDVQRYTRFVGIMKRALPMAARRTVSAAVLAYSLQPRMQDSRK